MQRLQGKVAVVTGASKGIGAGIAKALAAEGAAVVVNYASSRAAAESVVAEVKKGGGRAVAVQGDVAHDRVTAGARNVLPGDVVAAVLRAHLPRSDEQAAGESHPQGWPFHRWPPCV